MSNRPRRRLYFPKMKNRRGPRAERALFLIGFMSGKISRDISEAADEVAKFAKVFADTVMEIDPSHPDYGVISYPTNHNQEKK